MDTRRPKTTLYAIPVLLLALAASHGAWAQADDDDSGTNYRHTVSTGPSAVFSISGESERSSAMGGDSFVSIVLAVGYTF